MKLATSVPMTSLAVAIGGEVNVALLIDGADDSSDSSCGPGAMWLNRRSIENAPVRIRLGGSFTGCGD